MVVGCYRLQQVRCVKLGIQRSSTTTYIYPDTRLPRRTLGPSRPGSHIREETMDSLNIVRGHDSVTTDISNFEKFDMDTLLTMWKSKS